MLLEAAVFGQMQMTRSGGVKLKANAVSMAGAQQGSEGDDEDAELCDICWERPKEIIFMPCGHRVCA